MTDIARKAIALAIKEARALRHNQVGPEHVLLSILQLDRGVAPDILQKLGADRQVIRTTLLQALHRN